MPRLSSPDAAVEVMMFLFISKAWKGEDLRPNGAGWICSAALCRGGRVKWGLWKEQKFSDWDLESPSPAFEKFFTAFMEVLLAGSSHRIAFWKHIKLSIIVIRWSTLLSICACRALKRFSISQSCGFWFQTRAPSFSRMSCDKSSDFSCQSGITTEIKVPLPDYARTHAKPWHCSLFNRQYLITSALPFLQFRGKWQSSVKLLLHQSQKFRIFQLSFEPKLIKMNRILIALYSDNSILLTHSGRPYLVVAAIGRRSWCSEDI